MLRSVLIVVDAACSDRVLRRVAQLPIASDATLTVVESRPHASPVCSVIELWRLASLTPRGRLRYVSRRSLDRAGLFELARSYGAELVIVGDAGFWNLRIARVLGEIPVLVVRASSDAGYQRPLVAIDPRRSTGDVLHFAQEVLTRSSVVTAVYANLSAAEHARRVVADLVIVGSRPRSVIARLLFGSVTRRVLRNVACDVLAVPVPRQVACEEPLRSARPLPQVATVVRPKGERRAKCALAH